MKKNSGHASKVFFLIFSCLGFVLITGCGKKEIKNMASRGRNIICFGDSITFGYGANPGEDFPRVLSQMISIPVINAGIDGDNSIEALKRLDSDVLAREPLIVIIEFGGNDFLRKIPLGHTVKNIEQMVERSQQAGAMVALSDISAGVFLKEYRNAFKKIASEKGAIFISGFLSGIITNPSLKSDFIHPNADGYKVIAHRVYRQIRPYLNENILLESSSR